MHETTTESYESFHELRAEDIAADGWFFSREYNSFIEETLGNTFCQEGQVKGYDVWFNQPRTELVFFGNPDEKIYTIIPEDEQLVFTDTQITRVKNKLRKTLDDHYSPSEINDLFNKHGQLHDLVTAVKTAVNSTAPDL